MLYPVGRASELVCRYTYFADLSLTASLIARRLLYAYLRLYSVLGIGPLLSGNSAVIVRLLCGASRGSGGGLACVISRIKVK